MMKVHSYHLSNKRGTTMAYCCPYRLIAQFPVVAPVVAKLADVYSVAVIINEIISGQIPWSNQ